MTQHRRSTSAEPEAPGGGAQAGPVLDGTGHFGLLAETASDLLRSYDPQKSVDAICRRALEHLRCDVFFNFLIEQGTRRLRLNACAGLPSSSLPSVELIEPGVAVCGWVAETGERLVVESIATSQDTRVELIRRFGVRAYACHPLLGPGGVVLGTLSFGSRGRDSFGPDELTLMKAIADLVAIAIVRMRGEQDVRDREYQWRQLAESMPQLVWTCTPDGLCDYLSAQWTAYTGLSEAEQLGVGWLQQVHPEDRPRLEASWSSAVAAGTTFDIEFRIRRYDGAWRWFKTRAVPIRDSSGQITKWYGSNTDIEDLMTAVRDLQSARDALTRNEAELREADRRKNEFLAILSHELRNPLAPIRNSLYILEHEAPGSESARAAQGTIERQTTHMTRLVDDLLDITRITRGKVQLHSEVLELRSLARRAVEDHRAAFQMRGVDLRFLCSDDEIWVKGDKTRLAQVMDNLLLNAEKFTPAGGVAEVRVFADAARGFATLQVIDTGAGIAPDMLPHLFEPFMQADRTLDRSQGGLGLGLALARGLVELHKGTIEVRSEGLGLGSEFTVRLPLETERGVRPSTQAAEADGRASRRVLLIEDNLDAASSFRAVLRLLGHESQVAYTGPEGIEAARSFQPEIVLCDIGLPGMDGYAVARALRSEPFMQGRLLVALSGYAAPEDVRRCLEAGFDYHLAKPLTMDRLRRLLESVPEGPRPAADLPG